MRLTGWADAKDLKDMVFDLKIGTCHEIAHEIVNRACCECHRFATVLAEQVVTMTGCTPDVNRVPVRLDDTSEDIDCCENLERAIDGRAADARLVRGSGEFGN